MKDKILKILKDRQNWLRNLYSEYTKESKMGKKLIIQLDELATIINIVTEVKK